MQQLFAAFGVNWQLLLAQAVNFAIVLVALRYFLYTPVMTSLENRQKVVAKGVEDARLAGEKLAGADTEATHRISIADTKADELVKRARTEASETRTKMLQEAEERAAQVAKDAEARALETAARAKRDSEKDIARVAMLAAEKVMREKA
jgi:F-type H+-transporting ATPase subunit b